MIPSASIVISYLLGGITFVPLVLAALFCHVWLFLPQKKDASHEGNDRPVLEGEREHELEEKLPQGSHEPDVAAGYFAVCREYVPGGVNGKPPGRTTPAGEAMSAESPSVYQSMYRSIFERGKTQAPGLEAGKPAKKARNVFFVVLRHGHLVLFDNSEQLEIRHVIALSHHDVDLYAGSAPIPEGELFIKRNCIRMRKKPVLSKDGQASAPFYLFSDNCSEKEDFYHALLHNQKQLADEQPDLPTPLLFETDDMIKLIRYLHVSEENSQTRWLNALFGRLFLALYKTSEVEEFIRRKITKKMARVAKPAFITSLRLDKVEMGNSAPFFSNTKLREMTVDGALTLEADVRYTGNFKAVIAAVARIELGSRFKPREVNMILAGVLKKLEGHILLKVKPPPSNRLWISFETMPRLDISLEPIVSSRQITYGVILRALISRIREVFGETLVQPNWDDMPFTSTLSQAFRGGLWKQQANSGPPIDENDTSDASGVSLQADPVDPKKQHVASFPIDIPARARASSETFQSPASSPPGSPTFAPSPGNEALESKTQSPNAEKPKAMRSHSFAAAATPIVSKSPATTESARRQTRKGKHDAATAMKTLSSRSPENSPAILPTHEAPLVPDEIDNRQVEDPVDDNQYQHVRHGTHATESVDGARAAADVIKEDGSHYRSASISDSLESNAYSSPSRSSKNVNAERAKAINHSISTATTAAKNWSWGMLNRQGDGTGHRVSDKAVPMGRGQPLPPPGTPLPRPEKPAWSGAAFSSLRRKPVAINGSSTSLPATSSQRSSTNSSALLAAQRAQDVDDGQGPARDDVLTVGAPLDDSPDAPDSSSHVHETSDSASFVTEDTHSSRDEGLGPSSSSLISAEDRDEEG